MPTNKFQPTRKAVCRESGGRRARGPRVRARPARSRRVRPRWSAELLDADRWGERAQDHFILGQKMKGTIYKTDPRSSRLAIKFTSITACARDAGTLRGGRPRCGAGRGPFGPALSASGETSSHVVCAASFVCTWTKPQERASHARFQGRGLGGPGEGRQRAAPGGACAAPERQAGRGSRWLRLARAAGAGRRG